MLFKELLFVIGLPLPREAMPSILFVKVNLATTSSWFKLKWACFVTNRFIFVCDHYLQAISYSYVAIICKPLHIRVWPLLASRLGKSLVIHVLKISTHGCLKTFVHVICYQHPWEITLGDFNFEDDWQLCCFTCFTSS